MRGTRGGPPAGRRGGESETFTCFRWGHGERGFARNPQTGQQNRPDLSVLCRPKRSSPGRSETLSGQGCRCCAPPGSGSDRRGDDTSNAREGSYPGQPQLVRARLVTTGAGIVRSPAANREGTEASCTHTQNGESLGPPRKDELRTLNCGRVCVRGVTGAEARARRLRSESLSSQGLVCGAHLRHDGERRESGPRTVSSRSFSFFFDVLFSMAARLSAIVKSPAEATPIPWSMAPWRAVTAVP